ncbi:aminodeoxychorismate synthase, component I [Ectothiorhodospira shaposhnikovii]|uniref:aminodeoxychorismate synthase component I n=1 Tax=Ectothiorhodospira shaposhnikovii TaxID=1054 RepID=UPI001905C559|nr:aminodeoxychorismate synthase component I [Ectothiorhodospira shaposhnikovii]MBK1673172.1 aminodeoxychorismate synthase, component I [Ectothiorhodospira shaposhnikovii]
MCPVSLAPLPYPEDSARLFETLHEEPWAVFLDSARHGQARGRFDIITADPYLTLVTDGDLTRVRNREGEQLEITGADPFEVLRTRLGAPIRPLAGLPFAGGAVGYFGYDLARRLEHLPTLAGDHESLPQMMLGIHDWAVVVDHDLRTCVLVGQGRDRRTAERWESLVRRFSHPPSLSSRGGFVLGGPLRANLSPGDYRRRFDRVQAFIREGDCYQVNLAQRFEAPAQGDDWGAYRRLRELSPAPYGAFLRFPGVSILSNSPERFLHLRDGMANTRPIKGTRPRGKTPEEDLRLREALATSDKDRAENVMIVDLLRNDLGKTCDVGSVAVPELFAVESYATVHHLVSTVTGRLAPGRDAVDLLRGCFPGGSITGAPKLRAMEIIEALEPHRRGVYCGAIGFLGFDGTLDTSIAIRTLVFSDGTLRFWAGGGITTGSVMEQEYQETLDKAAAMMQLLETGVSNDALIQENNRESR